MKFSSGFCEFELSGSTVCTYEAGTNFTNGLAVSLC